MADVDPWSEESLKPKWPPAQLSKPGRPRREFKGPRRWSSLTPAEQRAEIARMRGAS